MPNTNCLSGLQCPKCKSLEPFMIDVIATFMVHDNGLGERIGDTEWDDNSHIECRKCEFSGMVSGFTVAEEKAA